jgi:hypothetical protein
MHPGQTAIQMFFSRLEGVFASPIRVFADPLAILPLGSCRALAAFDTAPRRAGFKVTVMNNSRYAKDPGSPIPLCPAG